MSLAVRTIRHARGITLEKMATDLRVNKGTLSKIERGKARPSFGLMAEIIAYFGGAVTANDFFSPHTNTRA